MSDHETVRSWLALSAAGLLDPGEERRVREHAAQCAVCAAELEDYAGLSEGMRSLPAPLPPPHLVSRTTALMLAEVDRRQASYLAGGAAILAFLLALAVGQLLRMTLGDQAGWAWTICAAMSSLFGAAAALVLTAARRRFERSIV